MESGLQNLDINPVNHVWEFFKQRYRKNHLFSNRNDFKRALRTWETIPVDFTEKLVESISQNNK